MEIDVWVAWTVRIVGIGLAFLWASVPGVIWVLAGVMALDYVSGVAAGYVTGTLSSDVGRKGFVKKLLMVMLVALAALIDSLVKPEMSGVLVTVVAGGLIANEGLSILENVARSGINIPKGLRDALAKVPGAETEPPSPPVLHG